MDTLPPHDLTPQERKKIYNRAYYQANREKIRKQQKEYNEAHPDEIKLYGQKWRESHRKYNREQEKIRRQLNGPSINARRRERYYINPEPAKLSANKYHQSHREHVRARQEAHRKANQAIYNARHKRYRQSHREQIRAMFRGIKARRRARIMQTGGSYSAYEWLQLKAKYNHACLCCGGCEPDIKLTADHIIPVTKGGHSNIDNIQPLCGSCNSKKHNKIIDYRVRFNHE